MEAKVIARWEDCGQGPAEQELLKHVEKGKVQRISGLKLLQIVKLKNDTKFSSDVPDVVAKLDPKKKYNVYYNYHPSSGYTTKIFYDGAEVKTEIVRPTGGVLCAFWSEVIIVEDNNLVSFPTRK